MLISRLIGLLMMVRVVALPLVIIALYLTLNALVAQLSLVTENRRIAIDNHLEQIQENTSQLAGWVGEGQNEFEETVESSFGYLANTLSQLNFEALPLPSFTVPEELSLTVFDNVPSSLQGFADFIVSYTTLEIPFASNINQVPQKIKDTVSVVKEPLERLADTSTLMNETLDEMQLAQREINALGSDIESFFNGIQIVVGEDGKPRNIQGTDWLGILRILLMILGGLLLIWYITSSYRDFVQGWRLLRGGHL